MKVKMSMDGGRSRTGVAEIVEHFDGIQNLLISNPVLVMFF